MRGRDTRIGRFARRCLVAGLFAPPIGPPDRLAPFGRARRSLRDCPLRADRPGAPMRSSPALLLESRRVFLDPPRIESRERATETRPVKPERPLRDPHDTARRLTRRDAYRRA